MQDAEQDGIEDARPIYAAINLRARAFLIDAAIVGGGVMALVILSTFLEEVPGFGPVLLIAMFGLIFFYEPILVAARGATIGHRRANIQVVSDATRGPPGFLVAFARFLIKGLLGIPSFVGMAFTRRHQAVHDLLTGTTVQLRDPSIARSYDFVVERSASAVPGVEAPRRRRIVAIVLYIIGAFEVLNLIATALLSRGCRVNDECTAIDRSNAVLTTLVFLAAVVGIVVLGWSGRLPGARRTAPVSPPA